VSDGVEPSRAEELSMLMTTAIEGAIIVARSSRDLKPLDLVHRQLRSVVPGVEDLRKDPRDDR
jgi:hypothetical protein